MMTRVSVCILIILHIGSVSAVSWNASKNITCCEHEDIQLTWEYKLDPGEYVETKSWYIGYKKTSRKIASWKDKENLDITSEYKGRVTMIGNDSLLLRNVTSSDEGLYTLIISFPLRSTRDPRITLNLIVYVPPVENECKPTISRLSDGTGLQAHLHTQGCGTQPYYLMWKNAPGTKANGDVLIFQSTEVTGTFRVCVTGPSVEKCFKGRHESLCQDKYIAENQRKPSQTTEQDFTSFGLFSTLTVVLVLWVIWASYSRLIKKCKKRNKMSKESDIYEEAMEEIAHILFVAYNNSNELALDTIDTGTTALLNSEIKYIDHESVSTENHQATVSNPSYEQCLYYKKELLKLLILQGNLGFGKTTWCRKFVKAWCKTHKPQYYGKRNQNDWENIKVLKSFRLLFFLSLRNVEKDQSLKDIIRKQCMMSRDTKDGHFGTYFDLLMKTRPKKLIFIIHGADEADSDVAILNEIVSSTKNSLTVLTCREWGPLQSKHGIKEEEYQPMACITLKQIDQDIFQLYANSIFDHEDYPHDAASEFMELVRRNKLENFIAETYFVQPLIKFWQKSGTLPIDAAELCLCLIEDNLKEKRKELRQYTTFNLDSDVTRSIHKVRGKIFVIKYGKVLCSLGKVALLCLQERGLREAFPEKCLIESTTNPDKQLPNICIAANLIARAPVSDSSGRRKRLSFTHKMIQLFLVAFYFACKRGRNLAYERECCLSDNLSEEKEIIDTFFDSLTETVPQAI